MDAPESSLGFSMLPEDALAQTGIKPPTSRLLHLLYLSYGHPLMTRKQHSVKSVWTAVFDK